MTNLSQLPPTQFVLYADQGLNSHLVRLLLEEKHLNYTLELIDDERPEELIELNPYHTLPVLANRDVALYEINVIFEYLEERHQFPRLLPATPKERAQIRLLAWRLQQDWLKDAYTLLTHPDSYSQDDAQLAKKRLSDSLITLSPIFGRTAFFMSDEFGWCDVILAPLLWRLPQMGIMLPNHLCRPLLDYQTRLFERPSFKNSLQYKDSP